MKRSVLVTLAITFLSLLASPASAQLSVVNPRHLSVSEEKARLILNTAYRVVAEQFKIRDFASDEQKLTLVLGETNERYEEQSSGKACTVYLNQWDEEKFAVAAMRHAVYRLAHGQRMNRMIGEVLRRANLAAPVSIDTLRRQHIDAPLAPANPAEPPCFGAIHNAAVRDVTCSPSAPGPR